MQRILPALILLILVFITFFSNQVPNITSVKPSQIDADFKFYNVTISMHSDGKKRWTIKASQSSIYNGPNTFFFHNVNGNLFGDNSSLQFSSPTGGYNMTTNKLNLVKTTAEINFPPYIYYLSCDEIEIDSKKNQLIGIGNLFINSEQLLLKGKKMVADMKKDRLEIINNVEGTIISSSIN